MSDVIKCPHCHAEIPHGARVCRGCHAEVEYGAPGWARVGALIVGAVTWAIQMERPIIATVTGIAVGLGLYLAARKVFAARISIRRLYRA